MTSTSRTPTSSPSGPAHPYGDSRRALSTYRAGGSASTVIRVMERHQSRPVPFGDRAPTRGCSSPGKCRPPRVTNFTAPIVRRCRFVRCRNRSAQAEPSRSYRQVYGGGSRAEKLKNKTVAMRSRRTTPRTARLHQEGTNHSSPHDGRTRRYARTTSGEARWTAYEDNGSVGSSPISGRRRICSIGAGAVADRHSCDDANKQSRPERKSRPSAVHWRAPVLAAAGRRRHHSADVSSGFWRRGRWREARRVSTSGDRAARADKPRKVGSTRRSPWRRKVDASSPRQ